MEVKFNNVEYVISDKKIIDNVNVKLKKGSINVILGPTGSGKSTMVQMLNALIYPTTGNVNVGDFTIKNDEKVKNINDLRFNVGLIYQFPEEQFFCETVKKEISFGLEFFNYKKNNIDKRVKDALKLVDLSEDYLNRDPFSLSSGEMRKVAIASVLAINPEIVVLDEPTIGLDSQGKNNLIKILKTIKRRYKKTIVIVSHDVEFIHKFADYLFVLNNGHIVLEGNKYEVFKQEKILKKNGILIPKIIEFELMAIEKKVKLEYRDDVYDLLKDILRNIC